MDCESALAGGSGARDSLETGTTLSGASFLFSAAPHRCFAATNTGLWDVTDSSDAPSQVVSFPSSVGDSGYGVATNTVSLGGHYLLYADELNGLYRYSETGGTWTKVAMGVGAGGD